VETRHSLFVIGGAALAMAGAGWALGKLVQAGLPASLGQDLAVLALAGGGALAVYAWLLRRAGLPEVRAVEARVRARWPGALR
jgi:hypothetical protein